MLRIDSPKNSFIDAPDLDWSVPEACWIDGASLFGPIYLHVPSRDGETVHRVHPKYRIRDRVEGAMLDEGVWYWVVRRR